MTTFLFRIKIFVEFYKFQRDVTNKIISDTDIDYIMKIK